LIVYPGGHEVHNIDEFSHVRQEISHNKQIGRYYENEEGEFM
jgi:hypothetical protein